MKVIFPSVQYLIYGNELNFVKRGRDFFFAASKNERERAQDS